MHLASWGALKKRTYTSSHKQIQQKGFHHNQQMLQQKVRYQSRRSAFHTKQHNSLNDYTPKHSETHYASLPTRYYLRIHTNYQPRSACIIAT